MGLGDDGKMAVESEPVKIGVFLPPVDAVSVFGIGLNYKKHAAETKSELPKNPGPTVNAGVVWCVLQKWVRAFWLGQCCS